MLWDAWVRLEASYNSSQKSDLLLIFSGWLWFLPGLLMGGFVLFCFVFPQEANECTAAILVSNAKGGQVLSRFLPMDREAGSVLCSFVMVQLLVKPQLSVQKWILEQESECMFIISVLCVEKKNFKATKRTVIKHASPFSKLGHYAVDGGVVFQKCLKACPLFRVSSAQPWLGRLLIQGRGLIYS